MYKIGIEKERYRTESCTAVWKKQGQKYFVPQLQNSGTRKKHRKDSKRTLVLYLSAQRYRYRYTVRISFNPFFVNKNDEKYKKNGEILVFSTIS